MWVIAAMGISLILIKKLDADNVSRLVLTTTYVPHLEVYQKSHIKNKTSAGNQNILKNLPFDTETIVKIMG